MCLKWLRKFDILVSSTYPEENSEKTAGDFSTRRPEPSDLGALEQPH